MLAPTPLVRLGALLAALAAAVPARSDEKESNIRVTVVAILASDKHKTVCKELTDIAAQIRVKEPSLTGFTFERTTSKPMKVGGKDSFHVVDKEFVDVELRVKDEKTNLVSLAIKPPTLGAIEYTTCCGKYFPLLTGYRSKESNEILIIAVMVKPCNKK